MYKKTKHKRRRIKVRQFFELIFLPILVSALFLLLIVWVMIEPLGIKFSSELQLIVVLIAIIVVIGSILFEISRIIIKNMMHYSNLDVIQKMFKRLLKK